MKFLFVSRHFPIDPKTKVHGVYKRMRMFLDAIKELADIDVLFYVPPDTDISLSRVSQLRHCFLEQWNVEINLFLCPTLEYENGEKLPGWYTYGAGAFSFLKQSGYKGISGPRQLQALETCLHRVPDAIFAHRLFSMVPLLATREPLPPIFFDLDDIEHIALKRSIHQFPKWYAKLIHSMHLPALLLGEWRAIRLAHKTFVCSESDQKYLTNRWRLPGIVTIPNAVTIPEKQPLTSEPTTLFIGSYSYKPNIDAAEFLIEKIWPLIYRKMPDAQLLIVGSHPDRIRGYNRNIPGVKFIGFVEDLDDLYRRSRVFCAPILSGAGTRVKIAEAAAYGKPIVATRIGAEGLNMRDGAEFLLRDDSQSFAEACIQLLSDPSLCERLGSAARVRAIEFYDRNKVVQLIQKHLRNEQ